jgi:hypothetical protein
MMSGEKEKIWSIGDTEEHHEALSQNSPCPRFKPFTSQIQFYSLTARWNTSNAGLPEIRSYVANHYTIYFGYNKVTYVI